jgi:hypothetical protein
MTAQHYSISRIGCWQQRRGTPGSHIYGAEAIWGADVQAAPAFPGDLDWGLRLNYAGPI